MVAELCLFTKLAKKFPAHRPKMSTKALQKVVAVLGEAKIPESSLYDASRGHMSLKDGIAVRLPDTDLVLSIQTRYAAKKDRHMLCNTSLMAFFPPNKWSPVYIRELGYHDTVDHASDTGLMKHLGELMSKLRGRKVESFEWSVFPALPESARDKLNRDAVEDTLAKFELANFNDQPA
jgi:hypothetical protein